MKSKFIVYKNFHKKFDLPKGKFTFQTPLHLERITNISGQTYADMMVLFFRREREENGKVVYYMKDARKGIRVAWLQRDRYYIRCYR